MNADNGAGAGTDNDRLASTGGPSPRHDLALWGAREGAWDWDLVADRIACCNFFREIMGMPANAGWAPPQAWFDRIHADDLPGFQGALRLLLAGDRAFLNYDVRLRQSLEGQEIWVQIRGSVVRDNNNRPTAVVGVVVDISLRKRMERQLAFDTFHDTLTGLPNRTLLLDRIGHALDRARRLPGRGFAVAIVDLDRFKQINDALGARQGDAVLKIIAGRLNVDRRTGDTLSRLSADEFCLVLMDVSDPTEASAAALRMVADVAEPIDLDGQPLTVTACVGVALNDGAYERPEDILRDASLAVYRAKQIGAGRTDIFDRALQQRAVANMRTEIDLRAALELGQFELFYQPIIALQTGRIAGFEALMRWRHPVRGLVPPLDFIPLAEDTGLIVPMGRWALQQAMWQLAAWRADFTGAEALFMSVNVSFRQFSHDNLPARVREVLLENQLPADCLKLEITESLLMHDPNHSRGIMEELRAIGVGLSIDDFGTGYSSLSYLHKLPADALKIDKSFVQAISSGESNAAIVQVVTTLAAILGMQVVAEGVEQPEEAQYLRDIMCRYAQGYMYSRPLPAAEIAVLLQRQADGALLGPPPGG